MEIIRRYRKRIIGVVIVFSVVLVILISLISALFKPDLRYERGAYEVSKDRSVTSCVVTNHGRGSAEKTRMSVGFLSRILDIWFSPGSAGKVVSISPDQLNAALELGNIAPESEVTIFLAVERPQDKPFEISMFDTSGSMSPRERATPIE